VPYDPPMGTRVLLAAGLVALVLLPGTSARILANTWTGTWDTEWGMMALTQTGSQVKGTYPHDTGHIAGTVTGNVFKGQWTELPNA
jgi:alkaline phosphatase D